MSQEDLLLYIVQAAVFGFAIYLGINAWKQERHWLATMVWGIFFGWLVEHTNISDPHCIYHYVDTHKDLKVLGVPAWVPVGWGCILYASSWTAQRLDVPAALRPLAAAFLAVNIDLSLDPVAHMHKYWVWELKPVNFCGVPFDNFLGWTAIVAIYAFLARTGLRLIDRRFGEDVRPWGTNWILPGLAAFASFLVYKYAIKGPLSHAVNGGHDTMQPDGLPAALVYAGVTIATGLVTWTWAFRARRDRGVNLPILLLPVSFHLLFLVIVLVTHRFGDAPTLLVVIPANLMIGFFAYSWPSLDCILARWGTMHEEDRHSYRPPPPVPAE